MLAGNQGEGPMSRVRDYRQFSHEDEIHMVPGVIHDPTPVTPPDYASGLDKALDDIARQDVSATGGPRGRIRGGR
jgi:hypothetical protein